MALFTLWFLIVIVAHIFYALVFVIDKYIVSRSLPQPVVYSFYIGVLGFVILILVPFGFSFPSFTEIILILIAGAAQVAGWVFMYTALNKGEVSRVIPFIGGFIAVFTLIFSRFLINESLTAEQLVAFVFLVLGGLILSVRKKSFWEKSFKGIFYRQKGIFGLAFLAALLFAIFWVITKYIFLGTSFVTGLIWMRTGAGLMALTLLIPKKNRKLIFKKTEKLKSGTVKFVFTGRALSVLAGLGVYLAVFLGSVTLTNALQGLQYVFILLLAFLFFKKYPTLKEQFTKEIIIQKILAIILIGIGLAILVL